MFLAGTSWWKNHTERQFHKYYYHHCFSGIPKKRRHAGQKVQLILSIADGRGWYGFSNLSLIIYLESIHETVFRCFPYALHKWFPDFTPDSHPKSYPKSYLNKFRSQESTSKFSGEISSGSPTPGLQQSWKWMTIWETNTSYFRALPCCELTYPFPMNFW